MTQSARLLGAVLAILAVVLLPSTPVLGAAVCGGGPTVTAPSSVLHGACFGVEATSSAGSVELRVTDALGKVLYDSTESNTADRQVEAEICLDSDVEGPIEVEATDAAGNVTTHTITIQ